MAIPQGYPGDVQAALARLVENLAAVDAVLAVVVYGSLAKGTWRAGASDVNVLVMLENSSTEVIERVAPALRVGRREALVRPMLLTPKELAGVADVFPIKLHDIGRYHDVIHGDDPFAGVEVRLDHLRLRVEQLLRNHLMQLRRHLVLGLDNDRELVRTLMHAARSLPIALGALLQVKGVSDVGLTLADVANVVDRELGLSAEPLRELAAVKHGEPPADLRGLYREVMGVVARAVEIADAMEPA